MPVPARCSTVDASWQCDARRVAQREGEMLWNELAPGTGGRGGWVYPVPFADWPPWRALPRFHWPFCPFCGASLPGAPDVASQADGTVTDDGN